MEVYLVRHTETVCEKGICYGQSDVGIRQPYDTVFESILNQLPQDAVLYSSPLQRCAILAKHIQKNTKIDAVIEDSRLMEMHFGDWEGRAWADIDPTELAAWTDDFAHYRVGVILERRGPLIAVLGVLTARFVGRDVGLREGEGQVLLQAVQAPDCL